MSSTIAFDIIARDRASDKFDKVGDSAHRSTGKLKSFAKVGGAALLVAAGAAVKWGVDSVQALGRIEKINAQTSAAIKSTGGAAGVTQKHVEGLAGKIETLTASEAESVQEGANLLLTFTNIQNQAGKGNKVFDQATRIMNDMSVAMGTDMKSSAMLVGKALNDPVKGATALSRAGVQLTDGQKETIKTFVESGQTMKAQKIILGELEKQFGGSGKAFADTAEGKFALVGHKFGEIGETIMTGLMPALSSGADAVLNFMNELQTGEGTGGKVAAVFKTVASNLGTIAPILGIVAGGFATYTVATKAAAVATAIQTAGTAGATGATWSLNAALRANPIGLVVTALTLLAGGLVLAYKKSETFRNVVDTAFSVVKTAGTTLWESGLKPAFENIKTGFEKVGKAGTWLWNNALQPAFKFIIGGVASILDMWSSMLDTLSKVPGFGWAKKAADAMANAAEKARAVADGLEKIKDKKVTVTVSYKYTGLRAPGGSGPTRSSGDDHLGIDPRVQKSAAQRLMDAISEGIQEGGKKLDKVLIASRDRIKAKIGQIRDDMKSMSSSIASALNPTDFSAGITELMASLTGNGSILSALGPLFETLKKNVSKGFLDALMSSGNSSLALSLAQDPAAAAAASAQFDANASMAQKLGDQTAQAVLGDKIAKAYEQETKKLVDQLKDQPGKTADQLGKTLAAILRSAEFRVVGGNAGETAYLRGFKG